MPGRYYVYKKKRVTAGPRCLEERRLVHQFSLSFYCFSLPPCMDRAEETIKKKRKLPGRLSFPFFSRPKHCLTGRVKEKERSAGSLSLPSLSLCRADKKVKEDKKVKTARHDREEEETAAFSFLSFSSLMSYCPTGFVFLFFFLVPVGRIIRHQ